MMKSEGLFRVSFAFSVLFFFNFATNVGFSDDSSKPNFVVILCDDLGIGDVQCFNPKLGKIKTPAIDKLAKNGMSFTDAHSGSSVCTPTRYGLLTGRYAWRTSLQTGVASGFGPCLIKEERISLGKFLQADGYDTALIGKWHLNMKFIKDGKELVGKPLKFTPPVGATSPDGPIARGFDYFYGIHHARSMKAIIEQDKVTKHDPPINFLPSLETKAVKYLKERSKSEKPSSCTFRLVRLTRQSSPPKNGRAPAGLEHTQIL